MKTKSLTLTIIIILFAAININAQKKDVFTNTTTTEAGTVKEYITYIDSDSDAKTPLIKNTCIYDNEGNCLEKTSYRWDSFEGWKEYQKCEYGYIGNNLSTVSHLKWNSLKKEWNSNFTHNIYLDSEILITGSN